MNFSGHLNIAVFSWGGWGDPGGTSVVVGPATTPPRRMWELPVRPGSEEREYGTGGGGVGGGGLNIYCDMSPVTAAVNGGCQGGDGSCGRVTSLRNRAGWSGVD